MFIKKRVLILRTTVYTQTGKINYYELNVNYLNITKIFLTHFRYIDLNVNINDGMNVLVYLTEIKTKKIK